MRVNYSADKRRRELAAKQKKEEKALKAAERKAMKGQPAALEENPNPDQELDPDKIS
jgi:hypothetical protein